VNEALALQKAGRPEALGACLRILDEEPDPLHFDYTPGVLCLIRIGVPSLPPLLDLLDAENEATRMHAERAVEGIAINQFLGGRADLTPRGERRWQEWWRRVGYDHRAPSPKRRAAIARLRRQLEQPPFAKP
jgi:hypothetical protein